MGILYIVHTMGFEQVNFVEGFRPSFEEFFLRLCPADGVMMMMNELVYDYLTTNYPLNQ